MPGLEIVCAVCGADALLRREPVYEGFRKTGERLLCAACGHEYADEDSVPFKGRKQVAIFTDDDKSSDVNVFAEDGEVRNCRRCKHYVVNPFLQRCAIHHKEVAATDCCDQFERNESVE